MKQLFHENPFWARLLFALTLIFAATFCHSQAQSNYPATVNAASGAPSGTCGGTNVFFVNTANGNLYTCPSGSWTAAGSGGSGTVSANSGSAGALATYASAGGSTTVGPDASMSSNGSGTLTLGVNGTSAGQLTLNGSTSGAQNIKCNPTTTCTSISITTPLVLGSTLTVTGHLLQSAASQWAGGCAMSASTTCTFTIASTFTNYLSFVNINQISSPPATAISATCSLSGTTVTITAGTSNSLTWSCMLIGNPS